MYGGSSRATIPALRSTCGSSLYPFLRRAWKGNPANYFALSEFLEVQHSPVLLPGALGTGCGVFSPKCTHWFVERTSMITHIYPMVLQAVSERGYAGCLDGYFQGHRGEAMQDLQRVAAWLTHEAS